MKGLQSFVTNDGSIQKLRISLRQSISIILLIVIILIIIVPAFFSNELDLEVTGNESTTLQHLYIDIVKIEVHKAGTRRGAGWFQISETVKLDLVEGTSLNQHRSTKRIPSGTYDLIRLSISNVTIVNDRGIIPVTIYQDILEIPIDIESDSSIPLHLKITYNEEKLLEEFSFEAMITVSQFEK